MCISPFLWFHSLWTYWVKGIPWPVSPDRRLKGPDILLPSLPATSGAHVARIYLNHFHTTDWIGNSERGGTMWENPFSDDKTMTTATSNFRYTGAAAVGHVLYRCQWCKLWHQDVSNSGINIFTGLILCMLWAVILGSSLAFFPS